MLNPNMSSVFQSEAYMRHFYQDYDFLPRYKTTLPKNPKLIPFGPADFQRVEKPKGVPLEIEFFLLRGVNERDWRGSGAF